jgi:Spy/CpxP family protein refolding chaperone
MPRARFLLVLGLVSLFLLAAGFSAYAQPPSGRPGGPGTFGGFGAMGSIFSQNDFFWPRLLGSEKTQKELKLSDDVITKIKELDEARRNKFRELMPSRDAWQEMAKLSDKEKEAKAAEYRKKVEALSDEQQDAIEKLLNQTQIDRLEQVALQVRGAQALDDKEIQEYLKLTLSQREKIKAARDESTKKRDEIFQSGDWQGMREKMTNLQKETDAKVLAILTEKQAKDFEAVKGPKIDGDPTEWLGGRGGFGRGPRP